MPLQVLKMDSNEILFWIIIKGKAQFSTALKSNDDAELLLGISATKQVWKHRSVFAMLSGASSFPFPILGHDKNSSVWLMHH